MHSAGTYLPNNGWKCANTKKYSRNTLRSLPSLVDAKAENITHDLFRFHIIFFDGIHFKVWIKPLNLHDLPNDVLHQVPICQTHANLALLRQAIPKKSRILWKQFIKCWLAWYGFCEVLFLFGRPCLHAECVDRVACLHAVVVDAVPCLHAVCMNAVPCLHAYFFILLF